MKKWILGICTCIFLCLVVASFTFNKKTSFKDISKENYKSPNNSLSYIVKDFNGQVAVFNIGEDNPVRIIEVNTDSLPIADQNMLKQGIKVNNQEELSILLEDLCS